jgi:hypothetical protein
VSFEFVDIVANNPTALAILKLVLTSLAIVHFSVNESLRINGRKVPDRV